MRRRGYGDDGMASTAVKVVGAGIGVAVLAGLMLVFGVLITGFFGWITGHIAAFFFGGWIETGLNSLVGEARFSRDMIPPIFATLAMVGRFFQTTVNNKGD